MSIEKEMNSSAPRKPMARGPMGNGPMGAVEKPKDLMGSLKKILAHLGSYKIAILLVGIFAICSTIFNVIGPKILGHATTDLSKGLMKKISGTGGIDFTAIGKILIFVMILYFGSAFFNFAP